MTATINTDGSDRTITFAYTAEVTKIDATLEAAAEAIYNEQNMMGSQPKPYSEQSSRSEAMT